MTVNDLRRAIWDIYEKIISSILYRNDDAWNNGLQRR